MRPLNCSAATAFTFILAASTALAQTAPIETVVTNADFVESQGYRADGQPVVTNVIRAASVSVTSLPGEITSDKIAFHFDAKDRAGWLFDATDTTQITNIPSTVGTRYLSTRQGAGTVPSLGMTNYKGPTLAYCETFQDYVVDFGKLGAKRGLCFDPIDGTNILDHIGTIVAVYDSEDSGGLLLGGGYAVNGGNPSAFKGRNWCRKNNTIYGTDNGTPHYASGMFDFRVTPGYGKKVGNQTYYPLLRHDGIMAVAPDMGFTGGWEVFSYMPLEETIAYNLEANGIGICPYSTGYSSGMKIAEMFIFNCVMPREAVEKLEAYLEKKWFKRGVRGYNGETSISRLRQIQNFYTTEQVPTEVAVPAETTLTVDRIQGGRGVSAKIVKTGEGTLKIGEMKGYAGDLVLNGGTTDISKKTAITSEAEFPRGLYAHFDANDAEGSPMTIEEADGKSYVRRWRSKVNEKFCGRPYVYAQAYSDARRPWLATLPSGKKVVDFGGYCGRYDIGGAMMTFVGAADDEATTFTSAKSLCSASTVIAVIGAQRSGGHFAGYGNFSGWNRNNDADMGDNDSGSFKVGLLGIAANYPSYNSGLFPYKEVRAYIDGGRADPTRGLNRPGYQVVALNGMGAPLTYLGAASNTRYGGFRLGEYLLFNRHLTDEEVRRVCAYLEKKWIGCDVPFYKSTSVQSPDVLSLGVAAPSSLIVSEGTVKVAKLDLAGTLIKTGTGTLEVVSSSGEGTISVVAGAVKAVRGTDVTAQAEVAAEPAFRLDPSDADSIEYAIGGEGTVRIVHSKEGRNDAYQMVQTRQPTLDATDTCNGLPVLDLSGSTQKALCFSQPFDAVRSAYVVWKPLTTSACLLGNANENGEVGQTMYLEYFRGVTPEGSYFKNQFSLLSNLTMLTNGVNITQQAIPSGEYELVEVHTPMPTHVSAIGSSQGYILGGAKYGEIILFERELSAREKVATRNYLMKKWMGRSDAELEPLPAAPTDVPTLAGSLAYAAGSTWDVAVKQDGTADVAAIAGTLSFGVGAKINLTGLAALGELKGRRIVIARAGAYAGVENVAIEGDVAFTAANQPYVYAKSNGDLVVKFGKRATLIILR